MHLKALFGEFTAGMLPKQVIDVTQVVTTQFLQGETITLPAHFDFTAAFTDPAPHKRKFLQLSSGSQRFNILVDKYTLPVTIELASSRKRLHLVYSLYLDPASNWQAILSGQLLQVSGYGLLDEANFHVCLTDTYGLASEAIALLAQLAPEAIVTTFTTNQFEYPAIALTYSLAQQHPDDIILYFHSKGMSHGLHSRSLEDIGLLMTTFQFWRRNLEAFAQPHMQKIGVFPAIGDMDPTKPDGDLSRSDIAGGWVWFNFWYARASYLIGCDEPRVESNRYLYERWLATNKQSNVVAPDCLNLRSNSATRPAGLTARLKNRLFTATPRSYFTAHEAIGELSKLLSENVLNRDMYSM